jgi:hypothetical protein
MLCGMLSPSRKRRLLRDCYFETLGRVTRLCGGLLLVSCVLAACTFDENGIATLSAADQTSIDRSIPDLGEDQGPDFPIMPDSKTPCEGLSCPLGCHTSATRCNRLTPSNIDPRADYDRAIGTLDLVGTHTLNLEEGTLDGQPLPAGVIVKRVAQLKVSGRPDGQPVQLVMLETLRIAHTAAGNDGVLLIKADSPVVIYARDSIDIEATLDVSATAVGPGPGGGRGGASDGQPGVQCDGSEGQGGRSHAAFAASTESGGGGAGFGQPGARGGSTSCLATPFTRISANAGGGGPMAAGFGDLVPLRGGCGGGAGGGPDQISSGSGGAGGHGGGAIQLSAGVRLRVSGSGLIRAGGSGGRGGSFNPPAMTSAGGGGGGSGGAILLEAPTLELDGPIVANGGGGGAGGSFSITGEPGKDGTSSRDQAAGGKEVGVGTNSFGGMGGSVAGDATSGGDDACNAGGGGGGAGRVRLNNLGGDANTNTTSPAATRGTLLPPW